MAKRYSLSESDRRKLAQNVRRLASTPRDDVDRRRMEPPRPPAEFRVGRADEAIPATTDPLTSGNIGSGTVSLYRWNETNEAWEDTGDDVEAYDFRGAGCAEDEWVHLHRLGHAGGVLWMIDANDKWESYVNLSGEIVPAYAVLQIGEEATGYGNGRLYLADKWDANGTVFAFNGPVDVAVGGIGACTFTFPALALFNSSSGTPANSEIWGPKEDQWSLEKFHPGLQIIGGIQGSGATSRVLVRSPQIIHTGYAEYVLATSGTPFDDTATLGSVVPIDSEITERGILRGAHSGSDAYATIPCKGKFKITWSVYGTTDITETGTGWQTFLEVSTTGGTFVDSYMSEVGTVSLSATAGTELCIVCSATDDFEPGQRVRVRAKGYDDSAKACTPSRAGRLRIEYVTTAGANDN